ncbi:hypothetical protein AZSI13_18210 [Azospira sp. I13]|nr:hypothetical protein AZSI13_18210 [Azospira sp. I13]
MRGLLPYVLPFALPTLCCAPARAEVSEQLSYQHYAVAHRPGQSLLAAINGATTIRQNGEVFHGHTRWNVRWDYRWRFDTQGRCTITSVNTRLESVITLPRLSTADPQVERQFAAYLEPLRRHELGHVQVGRNAARRIDQAIQNLPTMSSCELLSATANQRGSALIEEAKREELQYDQETGHGRTQGAWLPR